MIFKKSGKTEDVVKRKSYYGFASNYPGKLGSSKYVIGESRVVRKKEFIRKILIIIMLILLFAASFVITDICLKISERPVENNNLCVSYNMYEAQKILK